MSIVKVLPELRAGGGAQMALDTGLLLTAETVIARRYLWAPPALSLGKFQKCDPVPGVPFEVVRRPTAAAPCCTAKASSGRSPSRSRRACWVPGPATGIDVTTPYVVVAGAFAGALARPGRHARREPRRAVPALGALLRQRAAPRHPLPRREGRRHRPSQARGAHAGARLGARSAARRTSSCRSRETLLGEPWQGDGLAGAGHTLAPEMIWNRVLAGLETSPAGVAAE